MLRAALLVASMIAGYKIVKSKKPVKKKKKVKALPSAKTMITLDALIEPTLEDLK